MLKTAFEELKKGKDFVVIKVKGNSMRGVIPDGATVKIKKRTGEVKVGTPVLCKVKGKYYLHLVGAKKKKGKKTLYRIQNASGHVNGWISEENIAGILEEIIY